MKVDLFKQPVFRGAIALLSLIAILGYALWPRLSDTLPTEAVVEPPRAEIQPAADGNSAPTFGDTINALLTEISAQEQTDALILSELRSGAYTAEEPLLLDNPYGSSPLTALAVFTTAEPARVAICVHGKTRDADITNDFPALETEHLIPIYGLYADDQNTVTLTVTTEDGQKTETAVSIQTDAIDPNNIGNIILQTEIRDAAHMSSGLTFLYSRKLAFDAHGDIRWTNNTWTTPPLRSTTTRTAPISPPTDRIWKATCCFLSATSSANFYAFGIARMAFTTTLHKAKTAIFW